MYRARRKYFADIAMNYRQYVKPNPLRNNKETHTALHPPPHPHTQSPTRTHIQSPHILTNTHIHTRTHSLPTDIHTHAHTHARTQCPPHIHIRIQTAPPPCLHIIHTFTHAHPHLHTQWHQLDDRILTHIWLILWLQATNSSARPDVSIEQSQGFQTVRCLIGC